MFKSKYVVGRLTSGAAFCWQTASNIAHAVRTSTDGPYHTTFGAVYTNSFDSVILNAQCGTQAMNDAMIAAGLEAPRSTINSMTGYPDVVTGYPANMHPAVAYASGYGAPGGADAWTVFDARTLKPNYNTGPQFAIYPRSAV